MGLFSSIFGVKPKYTKGNVVKQIMQDMNRQGKNTAVHKQLAADFIVHMYEKTGCSGSLKSVDALKDNAMLLVFKTENGTLENFLAATAAYFLISLGEKMVNSPHCELDVWLDWFGPQWSAIIGATVIPLRPYLKQN